MVFFISVIGLPRTVHFRWNCGKLGFVSEQNVSTFKNLNAVGLEYDKFTKVAIVIAHNHLIVYASNYC